MLSSQHGCDSAGYATQCCFFSCQVNDPQFRSVSAILTLAVALFFISLLVSQRSGTFRSRIASVSLRIA